MKNDEHVVRINRASLPARLLTFVSRHLIIYIITRCQTNPNIYYQEFELAGSTVQCSKVVPNTIDMNVISKVCDKTCVKLCLVFAELVSVAPIKPLTQIQGFTRPTYN